MFQVKLYRSLSLVDMVGLVNEEFGVEIKTPDLPTLKTFADLYDYVYTRMYYQRHH